MLSNPRRMAKGSCIFSTGRKHPTNALSGCVCFARAQALPLPQSFQKWLVIDFFHGSKKDDNEVHCHFLVFFVDALHKTTTFFLVIQHMTHGNFFF